MRPISEASAGSTVERSGRVQVARPMAKSNSAARWNTMETTLPCSKERAGDNPSKVESLTPDLHGYYTRRRPQPARKGELYAALLTSEVHYQQASVPPQAAAWGRFSRTLHRATRD